MGRLSWLGLSAVPIRSLIAMAIIVCLSASVATTREATVETRKFDTGDCPEGSEVSAWYSVTTYYQGIPIGIEGRSCDGKYYRKVIPPVHSVSTDPTTEITHTGTCGSVTWYAQIVRNSQNEPVWIGGKVCDGTYYVIDLTTAPSTGELD